MVLREPQTVLMIVTFVLMIWQGWTKKEENLKHPNLESTIRSLAHSEELPGPLFTTLPDIDQAQAISLPVQCLMYLNTTMSNV